MKLEIKEWEYQGKMLKDHQITFNDIGDLWRLANGPALNHRPSWSLWRDREEDEWRAKFTGAASHKQAMDLAMNGWPEGEKIVEGLIQDIDPITVPRPELVMSTEGLFLDVGEFLTGSPEYWMNESHDEQSEQKAKAKIIPVNVSVVYSHSVPANIMLAHAAGISAGIKSIEASGVGVRLSILTSSITRQGERAIYSMVIPIKTENEPLCLSRQAFCLGHPSILRRVWFTAVEAQETDEIAPGICKGLGPTKGGFCDKDDPNKTIPCFYPDDRCSDATKIRDRFVAYCREITKEQGTQLAC